MVIVTEGALQGWLLVPIVKRIGRRIGLDWGPARLQGVLGVRGGKGIVGRAEEPLGIDVTSGVGEAEVSVQSAGDVVCRAVDVEEGRRGKKRQK